MKIIDRYLVRGFLAPLFFCVIFFCVLFIIIDAFNNIDEFIRNQVSLQTIAIYYLYSLPSMLIQVVPISSLVSLLLILGSLNKHNEIIALKASGVSSFQILLPYLFMGMIISFFLFLISETILPHASIASTSIRQGLIEKTKEGSTERSIKNVAVYSSGGRMIYAREYQIANQSLHDVVILEDSQGRVLKSKMTAKSALFENNNWRLFDVIQYDLDEHGELISEPKYTEVVNLDLKEKPEDFVKEASQIDFMSAKQLREYIHHLKHSNLKLVNRLKVDFHNKIAFPFISFIVMLIGAPLAMKTERSSAMVGIGTSFVLVVVYYTLQSLCLAMGKGGYLPPFISAWLVNVIFALIGLYLIRKTA